ncbi:MAG TPA: SsrA-binding protein SmpB [Candidatus Paceibacterota bacterium]|nr:SsrA-binding protein SmpB [Candidatus Paceibacterota bacterium]
MPNIAENKRAGFDYDITEKYEAGIELTGQEVKSAKSGHFNLASSYAVPKNGQLLLVNSSIPPYQPKNAPADYKPDRSRRLLLHKSEIKTLYGKLQQRSFSLVPLRAYIKKGFVKLELGLGKSRKKSDKREVIKKRDARREMRELI